MDALCRIGTSRLSPPNSASEIRSQYCQQLYQGWTNKIFLNSQINSVFLPKWTRVLKALALDAVPRNIQVVRFGLRCMYHFNQPYEKVSQRKPSSADSVIVSIEVQGPVCGCTRYRCGSNTVFHFGL